MHVHLIINYYQTLLLSILSKMTDNAEVTRYGSDIFADIYRNEAMLDELKNYIRDFGLNVFALLNLPVRDNLRQFLESISKKFNVNFIVKTDAFLYN